MIDIITNSIEFDFSICFHILMSNHLSLLEKKIHLRIQSLFQVFLLRILQFNAIT